MDQERHVSRRNIEDGKMLSQKSSKTPCTRPYIELPDHDSLCTRYEEAMPEDIG
jgi:hypothetical protein